MSKIVLTLFFSALMWAASVPTHADQSDIEIALSAEHALVLNVTIHNRQQDALILSYQVTPFEHFVIDLLGEKGNRYSIEHPAGNVDQSAPSTFVVPPGQSKTLSLETCHYLPEVGAPDDAVTFTARFTHNGKSVKSKPLTVAAMRKNPRHFTLSPGLEMRFRVRAGYWYDGEDGKPEIQRQEDGTPAYERSQTTFVVLNQQPNGSFRVVMNGTSVTGDSFISWFELFPNGQLKLIRSFGSSLEFDSPRRFFPLLPKKDLQPQSEWTELEPRTGVSIRYSVAGDGIKADFVSPLARVAGGNESITYELDERTRLPNKLVANSRFDQYKETHNIVATIKETIQHDRPWLTGFAEDSQTCIDAVRMYQEFRWPNLVELAITERENPGSVQTSIDEQLSQLIATRDSIRHPLFRNVLNQMIEACDSSRKHLEKSAQRLGIIAGSPASHWKLTDLDGTEHSSQTLTGRVIVFDFWFRQCSWCMRMMPQIEQVSTHYRDRNSPVTFFGVSVDEDPSDAKYVAETMKLNYPVLRSNEFAEQLGVASYPTLLVIAPDGTVRGIFQGFRQNLQEQLISCIEALLKK